MTESTQPFRGDAVANRCRPTVIKDWTDYNDHFNVAYYVRAFDLAAEAWRSDLPDAPGATTIQSRVSYLREVHLGRALEMTTQVLAVSGDSVCLLQAMRVVEDGYLAAIEERVDRLVDAGGEPLVPSPETAAALAARAAEHAGIPTPDGWGDLAMGLGASK